MNDFLDLKGASGAEYRFRLWREGTAHVPTAGNFVIVTADAATPSVLLVGVTSDLSQARKDLSKVAKAGATHVFTRLNVGRADRAAVHEDLVAAYKKAKVSTGA